MQVFSSKLMNITFKVKKENGSADRNCLTRTSKLPYPNFSLEFAYVKHIIRKY